MASGKYAVEILPAQGFSLVSFRCGERELLDQWDLARFIGTQEDYKKVSKNVTQTFRKGFGPSIGPWFGGRFPGDTAWNHGVCRFADWAPGLATGPDFIRSRLDGSRTTLSGGSLDEICGFHLDVRITYSLSENGLLYTVENFSEGQKGTFGIHWYFKNPLGTRVIAAAHGHRVVDADKKEPLDKNIFTVRDGRVEAAMNFNNAFYLENRFPLQDGGSHASLIYPDGLRLDFFLTESFKYTALFCTDKFLCIEPISGLPNATGVFDKGHIRIRAS